MSLILFVLCLLVGLMLLSLSGVLWLTTISGSVMLSLLIMGAVYGLSMLVDSAFFADVAVGTSPVSQLAAKLGVHTLLVAAYAVAAWALIRRR